MPSETYWFTSQVLHQIKGFKKLDNPDEFLEESSSGSHSRDLQKLA